MRPLLIGRFAPTLLLVLLAAPTAAWSQSPAKDVATWTQVELLECLQEPSRAVFDKVRACQRLALIGDDQAVPVLAALLADETLSTYARNALEGIPSAAATDALRTAMNQLQGQPLLGVIQSLGVRRDERSVKRLRELAESPAFEVSSQAFAALGKIADAEAITYIRSRLTSSSAPLRSSAADACLRAAQQLEADGKQADALSVYDAVYASDAPRHLRLAAVQGAILGRGAAGVPLLLEQLHTDESDRFQAALTSCARLSAPDLTPTLAGELDALPPERRALLIHALGNRGDAALVPVLVRWANAQEPPVRLAAIQVLGHLGNAPAVPVLMTAALSSEPDVAAAARTSLVHLPSDADSAIADVLRAEDPRMRALALEIAGKRAMVGVLPTILQAANDPNESVRLAAITAMGTTIDMEELSILTRRLDAATAPSESAAVRNALKVACKRMPDEDACARELVALVDKASPGVRCFLLELLRATGSAEAIKVLVAAANDASETVQDAATQALGEWMTADAAPSLLELAKSHPNEKFRGRALRGYLRIARQMGLPPERQLAMCLEAWPLAQRDKERKLILDLWKQLPPPVTASAALPLFDGKTFSGWDRESGELFRIEDGAIVVGTLNKAIAQNEFIATTVDFANFDLRLKFKLVGKDINAGVQFRSRRVPNSSEMIGYQADLGPAGIWGPRAFWGDLYDESRRNRKLAEADQNALVGILKPEDWNEYRIRCEARRIQIWVNGHQTVDYTEPDETIEQNGLIGLQIHTGPPSEAWYKDVIIRPLP